MLLHKLLPLAAYLGFVCLESVAAAPAASAPTVTIASGVVVGQTTSVTSGSASTGTAVQYLGIPFAAPPTGTLRFAPPATPAAWNEPLEATSLPPACRQQFANNATEVIFNNPDHPPPPESEDCLYLNVYAPPSACASDKKPVMFWIYGGNLDFGTVSLDYYNGSSFAAFQDVVIVAANYRTNIFGFSGSPELPAGKQNAGFLDQRLALQWVQDNIEQFGGDPCQVTIFGESAGAWSVKQILANPPDPLPFRAAILESEGATTGDVAASYAEVSAHYGCTTAASPLACLQAIDGLALEQYITSAGISFYPVADDVTSTDDVRPNILTKKFADVPVLLGTNSNEGSIFLAALGLDTADLDIAQVRQFLTAEFDNNTLLVDAALALYSDLTSTPFDLGSAILTAAVFTCTTQSLSTFAAVAGYSDIWRYYYNASFPNLMLYPDLGAFHSSEIPQVWGTYDLVNPIGPATPTQEGLSKYMQTLWANFAKNPTAGPGWPALTANLATNKLGELGGLNPTGETTILASSVDEPCALFDPVIAVEGL